MSSKKCHNPFCKEEDPEFYKGRSVCKKCFNKECNDRKKKKLELLKIYESTSNNNNNLPLINAINSKNKEIEELKDLVKLLARKLDELSIQN